MGCAGGGAVAFGAIRRSATSNEWVAESLERSNTLRSHRHAGASGAHGFGLVARARRAVPRRQAARQARDVGDALFTREAALQQARRETTWLAALRLRAADLETTMNNPKWKYHDDYVQCADCKTLRPLAELKYRRTS
jgi:hypothetical protein